MKFLVLCICVIFVANSAAKMNKKRGSYLPEEVNNDNYVVEEHGFNDDVSHNGGYDSGSSSHSDFRPSPVDSFSLRSQSNYNKASAHSSHYEKFPPNDIDNQYDHHVANGGHSLDYSNNAAASPSFNAATAQNFDRPHESINTRHSESTEKGRFPVHVPRTIVKTHYIERAVPQPYEVIKHVSQPYPVQRIRAVVKEVKVPQPYYINKKIVRQVPVERIIQKPFPVVKYVHVPVEHHVPVYVHSPQQTHHAQVVHYSVVSAPVAEKSFFSHAPLRISYSVPQSYAPSYSHNGLPQTYGATHSHESYGHSMAHAPISHSPSVAKSHGW